MTDTFILQSRCIIFCVPILNESVNKLSIYLFYTPHKFSASISTSTQAHSPVDGGEMFAENLGTVWISKKKKKWLQHEWNENFSTHILSNKIRQISWHPSTHFLYEWSSPKLDRHGIATGNDLNGIVLAIFTRQNALDKSYWTALETPPDLQCVAKPGEENQCVYAFHSSQGHVNLLIQKLMVSCAVLLLSSSFILGNCPGLIFHTQDRPEASSVHSDDPPPVFQIIIQINRASQVRRWHSIQ